MKILNFNKTLKSKFELSDKQNIIDEKPRLKNKETQFSKEIKDETIAIEPKNFDVDIDEIDDLGTQVNNKTA